MNNTIAFVITELEQGGAENNLARLAISLNNSNWDVTVISIASFPANPEFSVVSRLKTAGVSVKSLNCNHKSAFFKARRSLASLLSKLQPQIVHSFLFHAHVITYHATSKLKLPHVVGLRVAEPRRLRHRIMRRVVAKATHLVSVSDGVTEWAQSKLNAHRNSIIGIPNCIDFESFSTAKATTDPPKANAFWMTIVGRLHDQKGLLEISPTICSLLDSHPNLQVIFVGDGPLRNRLIQVFVQANLGHRALFLGRRNDVQNILAATDLFLLPSKWEGMPNSLIEAMASGKAVVAFDVHGVNDLLRNSEWPQSVSPDDYDAFERAVQELIQNEALRIQLGMNNQKRIKDEYSVECHTQRHLELYREVLG